MPGHRLEEAGASMVAQSPKLIANEYQPALSKRVAFSSGLQRPSNKTFMQLMILLSFANLIFNVNCFVRLWTPTATLAPLIGGADTA